MDPEAMAIELGTASWEEWVGAAQRAESRRALAASRRRRRPAAAPAAAAARGSLLWMLAFSVAGLWLLY
jgi:hypothetical protein